MFSVLPLFLALLVTAHGDHQDGAASGDYAHLDMQYVQRHMSTEHHIDSFDLKSFFFLHDLDRDGLWNREEIEAIYGVHHVYSQKKSKDEVVHQQKADHIVNVVLSIMDKNKDGKISPEEFEAAGMNGLPSFEGLGAEGHHYDVESEFFLHHEETYHNTPETQTDESYVHPEDIEHFAQHEAIERKEAEKEAKYQGIPLEEALAQHEHAEAPPVTSPEPVGTDNKATIPEPGVVDHPHADQAQSVIPVQPPPPVATAPKIQRQTPPEKQEPAVKYKEASKQGGAQPEWGAGESGYKTPKTPAEKLRKNVPYKYKFRRNWGDF